MQNKQRFTPTSGSMRQMMTKQENGKTDATDAGGQRVSGLDRDIQLRIGEDLRAMYDGIVNQGIPDRFVNLLTQLDEQRTKADSKESDDV